MTLDKDKTIVSEDEQHAPGLKKEPDRCVKSPTGVHEWNRYPKPDNRHLGVCKYCAMQRIFPGALTPGKTIPSAPGTGPILQMIGKGIPATLPPPPMPKIRGLAAMGITTVAPLAGMEKRMIDEATPTTPIVRKVTEPRMRQRPIHRTVDEKLTILAEWRSCKRGKKSAFLREHNVSPGVLYHWINTEQELRSQAITIPPHNPPSEQEKPKQISLTVPFTERLKIIDEYRSGKHGDKAAVCKKYDITKDTFDNWLKRQSYYRKVIERGIEAVHSETGKRTATMKKLHQLEDLPVEEAIGVLKDWRDILHKDAVAARSKADELAERTALTDIAIFKLVESSEMSRKSIHESLKNMNCWKGIFGAANEKPSE